VPELTVAMAVTNQIGADCLISDDSPNPYSWLLVTVGGHSRAVTVRQDTLDRDELDLA